MSYFFYEASMDEALTPEQAKAARALLAWPQRQLAEVAQVSISTIADFERGSRTPVANNAQAIRSALEAQGLQFIAGGVVEKTRMPVPPAPLRPGNLMRWIDATSLSQWGDRRDGQSGMSELLRRLIYAALGAIASVRFPYDESVQLSGWDGICSTAIGSGLIPEGVSGWEIGTQKRGITSKAQDDYTKRSTDPGEIDPAQSTFVFVTPRRFSKKDVWVAEKRAERVWRDVRVIDAEDLVHWLENYPAVAQWLATRIGRRPAGLQNLEETWEEWSRATSPPLITGLLLEDRDEEATGIRKWLMGPPALLSIQAESPDEAIAFLYSTIDPLPETYRLHYWSRCVVAANRDITRQLMGIGSPLIIVMSDPDPGLAQLLVEEGHHVYAAHGPEVSPLFGVMRLARPWSHNLRSALVQAGLAEEKAHQLARASGRSITVLRRLMPSPTHYLPKWVATAPPELLAAMLAGGWTGTVESDQQVLSSLAGRPYDQVEQVLAPLAATLDGPLRRSGAAWKVVSLRDLWTLLAPQLTPSMIERFEAAFHRVLGAINPRFDITSKQPWFEKPGQYGPEASPALRQGLSEALIALGVYPEGVLAVEDAAGHADRAVRKLLGSADARLWWSLSRDFRLLAEASPSAFLEGIESGLEGDNPPIMSLFRSDQGIMSKTEYLAELLWALEMLSRSPDYLAQAAVLLARLDEVDPGGQMGNRPAASLRDIFVCWAPQTYATPDQRLKVIDTIVRRHPTAGWKLLVALAPHFQEVMTPTPHPDWRDFAPDHEEEITLQALRRATREIGKRLLEQVGTNVDRWKTLLDLWASFEAGWRDEAAKQLEAYVHGLKDPRDAEAIREAIRDLLQRHRGFSDADWAMPEEDLAPLDALFQLMQPTGVEDRHRWLFQSNASFFHTNKPWEQVQSEIDAKRRNAAEDLISNLSQPELIAFAGTIAMPFELGQAIAGVQISDEHMMDILKAGLSSEEETSANLGLGLVAGLAQARGPEYPDTIWQKAMVEAWGERAELRIARGLPVNSATWTRIEARSGSMAHAFWSGLNVHLVQDGTELGHIVSQLIEVGRGIAAVHLLGMRLKEAPPSELLIRSLRAAANEEGPSSSNDVVMFQYHVGKILDHLDADTSVTEDEVATLEWIYFQVLRYSKRPLKALQRALAEKPELFVELIKMIYSPAEATGITEPAATDPDLARSMASQAYGVLRDWSRVPGSDDAGFINGAALESWVKVARKLCAEAGRREVGDIHIGQVLSAAKRQPGEPWPPEPVCELLEILRSKELEQGFENGTYNRRGVTVRSPFDGGDQERVLAESYRRDAEALNFDWLRAAGCLKRLSESYDRDARRHDQDAEQKDWS